MLSNREQLLWLFATVTGLIIFIGAAYKPVQRKRTNARSKEKTIEAPRYVILNETGNILVANSQNPTEIFPAHIEKVFLEALSSLCLITRAISTTINPVTGKYFSAFSHFALERVLDSHPLFIHLGQELAEYKVRRNKDFVKQSSNDLFGVDGSHTVQKKMNSIYNCML